jgi:hypothetical protein
MYKVGGEIIVVGPFVGVCVSYTSGYSSCGSLLYKWR